MAKEEKPRKRMVVEEVKTESAGLSSPPDTKSVEVIKEKVEELQNITENMGESLEKSEEVQEEIVKVAEKTMPVESHVESLHETAKTTFVPVKPASGPNPLFILIPGVLLLGALLGGVYFYQKGINQVQEPSPSPLSTVEPVLSPSASPSATLNLTKYPINVQNGSGTPGTAGSAKDLLTKAGFKVSTAGNADNYNYTDTIIKTKADVGADFISKLTTTLSGIYSVAKPQALPDTSKDEVVVIIGSSKAQ
jgi:hypothetical protein